MNQEIDSGIYNLIIHLPEDVEIKVGSLGKLNFKEGYYIYTGTAQRNLTARVARHKRKKKKLHWHIDYLLQKAEVIDIKKWPGDKEFECKIHQTLLNNLNLVEPVSGFGASDCNCNSHLLYSSQLPIIDDKIEEII
ncbi:GIY-YIG nuclease family protein [Selenihalanaerobacter shriftii]|uniref:Uri superfamily endonuclease n=1 Tax=Selenihalanaerobacter shriftii TaxID=142842 RepID=A0A1T4KID1_9FIRM|nr:GIY-YIG nuclease family protein [Selenihalanaerobacter shriftii]SJZ42151.1 Uri superfamily endonuclease [Selenihalanaerobacter shriftii]